MKFLVFLSILIMSFNVVADDVIGGENVEVFTFLVQNKSDLASCVEKESGFYPVLKINPVNSIQDDQTYYYVNYNVSDVKKKMNFTYKAILPKEFINGKEELLKKSLCSSLSWEIYEQLEKNHVKAQRQALFIENEMNIDSYGVETKSQMDSEENSNHNVWFLVPGQKIDTHGREQYAFLKTKIGVGMSKLNGEEKKYLSVVTSPFYLEAADGAQMSLGSVDFARTEAKIYLSDKGIPNGQITLNAMNLDGGMMLYTQKNLDVLFKFGGSLGVAYVFDGNINGTAAIFNVELGIGTLLFERLQMRVGIKESFTTPGADRFETTYKQTDSSVRYDAFSNGAMYALASLRLDEGLSVYGEFQGNLVTAGNAYKNGKSTSDASVKRSTLNIGIKFTP